MGEAETLTVACCLSKPITLRGTLVWKGSRRQLAFQLLPFILRSGPFLILQQGPPSVLLRQERFKMHVMVISKAIRINSPIVKNARFVRASLVAPPLAEPEFHARLHLAGLGIEKTLLPSGKRF